MGERERKEQGSVGNEKEISVGARRHKKGEGVDGRIERAIGKGTFRGSAIPGSVRQSDVVIQGHRATWMTKSMLLNYATDYQKSEAPI